MTDKFEETECLNCGKVFVRCISKGGRPVTCSPECHVARERALKTLRQNKYMQSKRAKGTKIRLDRIDAPIKIDDGFLWD